MRAQVAIAPTLLVAVVYRHRRGTELDQLNQLVNVLQSIQLPFALLPACPRLQDHGYQTSSGAGQIVRRSLHMRRLYMGACIIADELSVLAQHTSLGME